VVAIVNYALRAVMMISMFTFISLAVSRAKASGERISMIMHEKTIAVAQTSNNANHIKQGSLHFDSMDFSFHNSSLPILYNIHFHFHLEETIAIMDATDADTTT